MKLFKILTFIIMFLLSTQALAHSKLMASVPTNGAELTEAPKQIMLEFNRKVRLIKLEVSWGKSEPVDIAFKPVMGKAKKFAVDLPELTASSYQVKWMAMSGDSHKMKGAFDFVLTATTNDVEKNADSAGSASVGDAATAAPDVMIDHQNPVSVANSFAGALSRGNTKLLKVITAPEVIIYEEGSIEYSFAEYSSGHLKSDIAFMSKFDRTVKSQHLVEDSKVATVITHSELRTKAADATSVSHRNMLETMVLEKAADGWKIIHIHWSSQKG